MKQALYITLFLTMIFVSCAINPNLNQINSSTSTSAKIEIPVNAKRAQQPMNAEPSFEYRLGFGDVVEVKFFHIESYNISTNDFLKEIEKLGVSQIVVLERKNYLRKIISSVKASITDSWHQPAGVKANNKKIRLNPEKIDIDSKSKSLIMSVHAS